MMRCMFLRVLMVIGYLIGGRALAEVFRVVPAETIRVTPLGRGVYYPYDPIKIYDLTAGYRTAILTDATGNNLKPWPNCPGQWNAFDEGEGRLFLEDFPSGYFRKGDRISTWKRSQDLSGRITTIKGTFVVGSIDDDSVLATLKP